MVLLANNDRQACNLCVTKGIGFGTHSLGRSLDRMTIRRGAITVENVVSRRCAVLGTAVAVPVHLRERSEVGKVA
jgi:hypothetical protein